MGVLQRIKGKHMAPIRHSIPAKFWEYLPNDFLNSAVVDSYDSEDLLRPFFPSTIVHPGLSHLRCSTLCYHLTTYTISSVVSQIHDLLHIST